MYCFFNAQQSICSGYYYNNYQSDGVHGEGEQGEGEYPEGEEGVQEYHYVKPRTLPIPVRWEVANYSKKEGIDLQTDLLNAQDRWFMPADLPRWPP